MKKTISVILAAAMMMSLASCKKKTEPQPSASPSMTAETAANTGEPQNTSESAEQTGAPETQATEPPLNGGTLNEENAVGVNEENDGVSVTYPKDFFDPSTDISITDEMKEMGYQSVSKNEDGTVTYVITKDGYQKLKNKMKNDVIDYFKSVESGEKFKSIKKVEYDDDFSTVTMTVDQEAFKNSLDVTASRAIYWAVSGYKIFCGEATDKAKVTIIYIDESSKAELSKVVYPDQL